MLPSTRPDVNDPIRRANGVFIVFDDDQGVSETLELHKRLNKTPVIALVQADAWLIENVEHPGESGPDLRCEPDALGLSARQRSR